jgi:hypothetical protein
VCDDRDLRRVLRAHDAVGLLVANPDGTVKGDAEGEFVRVISQVKYIDEKEIFVLPRPVRRVKQLG